MSSPSQRIIIGVAASIVVIITIFAALFLATQDQQLTQTPTPLPATATEVAQSTATATHTSVPPTDTDTPEPTATDSPTAVLATETSTPLPTPTNTDTDTPEPTPTETPVVRLTDCDRTPLEWPAYQIQRGDDWQSLASRVDSTTYDLQQANCRTSTLQPNEYIYLPFIPPTPTPTDTPTIVPTDKPTPRAVTTPTFTPTPAQPTIDSVSPHDGQLGQEVRLFIFGHNLGLLDEGGIRTEADFSVELIMVEPNSLSFPLEIVRATSTDVEAVIPATIPEGCYDLLVVNPGNPNNRSFLTPKAYTNDPLKFPCVTNATPTPTLTPTPTATPPKAPSITECIPKQGNVGQEVLLECTGQNFDSSDSDFQVDLRKSGDSDLRLSVLSGTYTNFKAIIPTDIPVGLYDLIVTNPDEQKAVKANLYEALQETE
ncbi:hypothetical protein QUF58_00990 [Anaerolineales bacterium HSG24]|nr:hypothetical protein [Anaerolineales bacterium HSG24]